MRFLACSWCVYTMLTLRAPRTMSGTPWDDLTEGMRRPWQVSFFFFIFWFIGWLCKCLELCYSIHWQKIVYICLETFAIFFSLITQSYEKFVCWYFDIAMQFLFWTYWNKNNNIYYKNPNSYPMAHIIWTILRSQYLWCLSLDYYWCLLLKKCVFMELIYWWSFYCI